MFKRKNNKEEKPSKKTIKNNNKTNQEELVKIETNKIDISNPGNIENVREEVKVDDVKNISTFEFFVDRIINKATHGELDVQESDFEITFSRILSANSKKRIIAIQEFPEYVLPGHLEAIRNTVLNSLPVEVRKGADINIVTHVMPDHTPVIGNKKLDSSKRNFIAQAKKTYQDYLRQLSAQQTGRLGVKSYVGSLDGVRSRIMRLYRRINSYEYLSKYKSSGGEITKSFIFFECCGDTIEKCDKVAELVIGNLVNGKYKFKEITELSEYMKKFGVAGLDVTEENKVGVAHTTLTTELTSSDMQYSEGIIRSDQGDVYVLTSLDTGYPVFISFSESADSGNMIILGKTGSGKTLLAKSIILNALNHKDNTYNLIIDDLKGSEYTFDKFIDKTAVISMGISNPLFINTLAIPDYKEFGFPNPQAAYTLCFNSTIKLLATLTGTTNPEMADAIYNVCTDIVDKAYIQAGVDKNLSATYDKSHQFVFREHLWDSIVNVTTSSKTMESRHSREVLGHVRASLEPYFMDRGAKAYMFDNSLNIDEAMKLKVLIFDYGVQTAGGQSSMLDKEIESRLLMRNFFATLYAAKNKLNKEYTLIVAEEIQRQLNNPHLAKMLNDTVTGGRSSNISTILITNTITPLLESKSIDVGAIKENIKTILLGKVNEEVADKTMDFFGLQTAKSRVVNIISGMNEYQHSFLLAFDTGKVYDMTVGKVVIPKKLVNHEIFKSRDIEVVKKKNQIL